MSLKDEQACQYGPDDYEAFYLPFPNNQALQAELALMSSRTRPKQTAGVAVDTKDEHQHHTVEESLPVLTSTRSR